MRAVGLVNGAVEDTALSCIMLDDNGKGGGKSAGSGGWRDVVEAASCIESAIVTTDSDSEVSE